MEGMTSGKLTSRGEGPAVSAGNGALDKGGWFAIWKDDRLPDMRGLVCAEVFCLNVTKEAVFWF